MRGVTILDSVIAVKRAADLIEQPCPPFHVTWEQMRCLAEQAREMFGYPIKPEELDGGMIYGVRIVEDRPMIAWGG